MNSNFLNKTLIYNPCLRFRNNKDKCVAYVIDKFFQNPYNFTILSSSEIIFLLLFDGFLPTVQVIKSYAYIFKLSYNNIDDLLSIFNTLYKSLQQRLRVEKLLFNINELSETEKTETRKRYNIKDFIISDRNMDSDFSNLRLLYPVSINFNVTTVCDFKCRYCYHPLNLIQDYISADRLKIIFKELKEINCESVLLTGGDPMLRHDIDNVIKILSDNNLAYTISTKTILQEDRIKKLRYEYGLKTMQVSLDSINSDCVKYHLGISDDEYVSKALRMIETLINIGVRVRIKSVVTPYNIKNIKETLDCFTNLGVEGLHLAQYSRSFYRHHNNLFLSNYQLNIVRAIVKEFRKKNQCKNNFIFDDFVMQYRKPINAKNISDQNIFSKRGICNAGRFSITLLPNGEITICENLPYKKEFVLGDLRKQSVMEYWNSDRVKQRLSPPPRNTFADGVPCKICPEKYYTRCHKIYSRCLRFSYETFGTTHTSDINCPYIKFKKYRIK